MAALFRGRKGGYLRLILQNGIPNCKVYVRKTPQFARKWVVKYGNLEQDSVTLATPQQYWDDTEESWSKFRAVPAFAVPAFAVPPLEFFR